MIQKLSGPMLAPRDGGAPTLAVVLLHGYGSDGQDLIGLAPYWRELLPGALFVAPNAPARCAINPAGYEWFPLDPDRPQFRAEGAALARPVLIEFLNQLWAQTGLGPATTILAGFSQGAMMALHVGLALDEAPLGLVAFSGALIAPPRFDEPDRPRPPVCVIHGEHDPVVDPRLGAEAVAALRDRGFVVTYHVEPGAGHTITEDGLAAASAFLAQVVGAATQSLT